MLHSLISSLVCLYTQSCSRHSPYIRKNRQTGIRDLSYWWRNPQASPFIHRLRSQCRQTVCRKLPRLFWLAPGPDWSAETAGPCPVGFTAVAAAAAPEAESDWMRGPEAAPGFGGPAASRPPSKSKLRPPSESSIVGKKNKKVSIKSSELGFWKRKTWILGNFLWGREEGVECWGLGNESNSVRSFLKRQQWLLSLVFGGRSERKEVLGF